MTRLVFLLLGVMLAMPSAARMYQWADPNTGTPQMSGTPPAWYRSGWGGPRVRVFDNGRIVDDTVIAVSDEQSRALREEAFRQHEEAKQLQALRQLEEDALEDASQRAAKRKATQLPEEDGEPLALEIPEAISEQRIEELKGLIEQWDSLNLP